MSDDLLLAIGSYTAHTGGRGDGISLVVAAADGTRLTLRSTVPAASPSFLRWAADGRSLFAAHETDDGSIGRYDLSGPDPGSRLEPRGSVSSHGARPCHLALHPSGRTITASNYGGGTYCTVPIDLAGDLGGHPAVIRHEGAGAHPTRQDRPHPHAVLFTSDGSWALLVDGGLDTLSVHAVDRLGRIAPQATSVEDAAPGAGPRHARWLPDGGIVVVEELTARVSRYDVDVMAGRLHRTWSMPSSVDGSPDAWPSEIAAGQHGTVVVANRALGVLSVLDPRGRPARIRDVPLPSGNARHFWITGSIAFVALQDSDRLVAVDLDRGRVCADLGVPAAAYVAPHPG